MVTRYTQNFLSDEIQEDVNGEYVDYEDYQQLKEKLNLFLKNQKDIRYSLIRYAQMYDELGARASSYERAKGYYAERDRIQTILKEVEKVKL